MRRVLLLALIAACGGGEGTVVLVRVDSRSSVQEVTALRATARAGSSSAATTFDLDGREFPLTFTVTPTGRTGEIEIVVEALDPDGLLRGRAEESGLLVEDGLLELAVLLEPADFVVNAEIAGTQRPTFRVGRNGRQVGAAPNGDFVVGFVDDCAASGRCDVFGRFFDAQGLPRVNQATMSTRELVVNLEEEFSDVPAVAATAQAVLIAWETFADVRAMAFSPDGAHRAEDDAVLSAEGAGTPSDPAVAALAGGDFMVVWAEAHPDGGRQIRGRFLDGDGVPATNPVTGDELDFPVSVFSEQDYANPSVAAGRATAGEGRSFAVVWESSGNVMVRFFDQSGVPRSSTEQQITTFAAGSTVIGPHATFTNDGNLALAVAAIEPGNVELEEGGVVFGRFSPPTGMSAGPVRVLAGPLPLPAAAPAIAGHPAGTIGVSWHQCGDDGDGAGCGVFLQLLSASGADLSPPRIANTTLAGDQTNPSIAATPDGFILVWADESRQPPDTSEGAVRARLFHLD